MKLGEYILGIEGAGREERSAAAKRVAFRVRVKFRKALFMQLLEDFETGTWRDAQFARNRVHTHWPAHGGKKAQDEDGLYDCARLFDGGSRLLIAHDRVQKPGSKQYML
ncbi:MAG: hypothetical protein QUV08_08420 [Parasphingorhabdus sp.]|nr:hypothetical protein [Parasphingorhabdus sp.]